MQTIKKSATALRIETRAARLATIVDRELTSIVLNAMTRRWSEADLKAKQQGQNQILNKIHDQIIRETGESNWCTMDLDKDLTDAETGRDTKFRIANNELTAQMANKIAADMVAAY